MGSVLRRWRTAAAFVLPLALAAAGNGRGAEPEAPSLQDEAGALTRTALRYEHAEGVTRDFRHAANLYCRAARIGRAEAQYRLGWMYANGRGVPRDDDIAAALFEMAAAQGHEQSKRVLLFVRPKAATRALPPCMVVADWTPELKLSRDLAALDEPGAAGDRRHDAQASVTPYSAMHAVR